jgi:hypothetical protein
MVLLAGLNVTHAGDFTVLHEKEGDTVLRDGNNVTDEYIEAVRDCQNELDTCRDKVDEAPKEGAKDFTDGILWGSLGTVLLFLLL